MTFKKYLYYYLFLYVMCMCAHACIPGCQEGKERVRFPGTAVIGSFESSDVQGSKFWSSSRAASILKW